MLELAPMAMAGLRTRFTTRVFILSRLSAYGNSLVPAAVGTQPLWERTIRHVLNAASSFWMCCDTVACDKARSCAAARKFPVRTTAMKLATCSRFSIVRRSSLPAAG